MSSLSPVATVFIVGSGLLLTTFAAWALYTHLIPYLHRSQLQAPPLPQTMQHIDPTRRRSTLRSSFHSKSSHPLLQEPRSEIPDFDLESSRCSTNMLDASRPSSSYTLWQAHSRGGSLHSSHSRVKSLSRLRPLSQAGSHSRSPSLADLRTFLYAEKGLLSASPRDSTLSLAFNPHDLITSTVGTSPACPKPVYLDSGADSTIGRAGWSIQYKRSSTPKLGDSLDDSFLRHGLDSGPGGIADNSQLVTKKDVSSPPSQPEHPQESDTQHRALTKTDATPDQFLPGLVAFFEMTADKEAVAAPVPSQENMQPIMEPIEPEQPVQSRSATPPPILKSKASFPSKLPISHRMKARGEALSQR